MKHFSVIGLLAVLPLLCASVCSSDEVATGSADESWFPDTPLERVSRVTYRSGYGATRSFSVASPDSVRALVALLEFKIKLPCACAHTEELWLEHGDGISRFSICKHCLIPYDPERDSITEPPLVEYGMPDSLWTALQALREDG